MDPNEIINEGKKTSGKIFDKIKETAKTTASAVNNGLLDHGIDTKKLGSTLAADAKNAGNFVVGGVKMASDKAKDAISKKPERPIDEVRADAIQRIKEAQADTIDAYRDADEEIKVTQDFVESSEETKLDITGAPDADK